MRKVNPPQLMNLTTQRKNNPRRKLKKRKSQVKKRNIDHNLRLQLYRGHIGITPSGSRESSRDNASQL